MLEAGGGGGGSHVSAHSGRMREVAGEYDGLVGRAQSALTSVTSAAQALAGAGSHPDVSSALETAQSALLERIGLVGLGLGHCRDGLTACASDYDEVDEWVASRMTGKPGA